MVTRTPAWCRPLTPIIQRPHFTNSAILKSKQNILSAFSLCIEWVFHSSASLTSSSIIFEFLQLIPLQFLHETLHSIPFLRQVHLSVSQDPIQEHLIILKRSFGAGGKSVMVGNSILSLSSHPHCIAPICYFHASFGPACNENVMCIWPT